MASPEDEKLERLRNAMYSRSLSEQLRARDRRTLRPEKELVGEDWSRDEPELGSTIVAPRSISWIRRILWGLLWAGAIFFVCAVFYFIYYFTIGGGSLAASPSNIDIAVSGPANVAGGEPTELQIAVTNNNRVPLELTRLIVTYPDGTRSASDFQTPEPQLSQDLGSIDPGATRQGTVTAVFSGTEGQHANVKVELEYHLNGSSAIFVASSSYDLTFSSSPLSISIDGNTQAISGQPMQINVTVTSNTKVPVKDALLHIDFPFGFKLTSSAPTAVSGADNLWALGDLQPGDKRVVTLMGTLTGETNDVRVFNFSAGTRLTATSTAISTQLATNMLTTNISKSFLGLSMTINGATGSGVIISPGDPVTVTIGYQNNLTTKITNAIVVAKLSGFEIDGSTVTSLDGFYRSSDDSIIWNKSTTNGRLLSLNAGDSGTLSFTFKVPSFDALKNISNPRLNITLNAAGDRVSETGVPQTLQSTLNQPIAIASNLNLTANGLYYASPYGSTGPLPPKANVETTYAMVLTITNTTNKIDNASVTATLPPYVRWTGKNSPSSEKLVFNQINSTVTWNVGTINPGVGLNGNAPRQVGFEIGFTPSTSQIGQQPVLLGDIQLTGTDDSTGAMATSSAANVTTNVIGDTNFNETNATVVN